MAKTSTLKPASEVSAEAPAETVAEAAPAKPAKSVTLVDGTVRAKFRGYASGEIRDAGAVFPFKGPLGSWMEPVADAPVAAETSGTGDGTGGPASDTQT